MLVLPQSFVLIFEKAPLWLLALNKRNTGKLYIPGCTSLSNFSLQLTKNKLDHGLYYDIILNIGINNIVFSKTPEDICVLVCGTIPFLNDQRSHLRQRKGIFIADHHVLYRSKRPHAVRDFARLTHVGVGGATTIACIYLYSPTALFPKLTSLRRKLGDFLDYSIFPSKHAAPPKAISYKGLLPHTHVYSLVRYPTHFSITGLGVRQLKGTELWSIFGIPGKTGPFCLNSVPIPVQILDALLHPFTVQEDIHHAPGLHPILPAIYNDIGYTTIPYIYAKLSNNWYTQVSQSTTSVKSDSATIESAMWNQRITSIWKKCQPHQLDWLRNRLLPLIFSRLFTQFKKYMLATHFKLGQGEGRVQDWSLIKGGIRHKQPTKPKGRREQDKDTSERMNHDVGEYKKDLERGREVVGTYLQSTFMSWEGGSTLIFWNWPESSQATARDGFPPFIIGHLPSHKQVSTKVKQKDKSQVLEKLLIYLNKGYLKLTPVHQIKNFIDYFPVPKGPTDIRLVFNGTSCGVNGALFASNFWLPMSGTMTRLLSFGYRVVDMDIGEMFLNFPLHKTLQPYSGVDLSLFKAELKHLVPTKQRHGSKLGATWTRLWFGMRQSPEHAAAFYYLAEEFIRGKHDDKNNPLRWDSIVLNLVGNMDYNPTFPNVYKWDNRSKRIAGDIIAYVDDLRAIGFSMEQAWLIARRVASHLQYLGIQDAARKRRLDEGPWAGGVYSTNNRNITKSVTKEKWEKGRKLINDLIKEIGEIPLKQLSYKLLERIRGFLCHLAMVYDVIFPYLKGFHLTLAQHLPRRDEEGWKLTDLDWIGHIEAKVDQGKYSRAEADILIHEVSGACKDAPSMVTPVPRFHKCLKVLATFFQVELPPIIKVMSSTCTVIMYGFVDASGSGFGSTLLRHGNIEYRIGTWSSKEENNSSNWREFENLVCEVEKAGDQGWLNESILLMATDNQVVESCLYKGNSTSPKLFDLVVRLKLVELKYGTKVMVTHVSGKRMQAQGTDGVSRGCLKSGVAMGQMMLEFCPWGKSCLEISPKLKEWVTSWAGKETEFLSHKDWYLRGHDIKGGSYDTKGYWQNEIKSGVYVWAPPPAAADACLEELRKARMKRKESTHIIIIQRLMAPTWLKQLHKCGDCIFSIPASHSFWPTDVYEPLIVAILFPYISYRPFQLKTTFKMFYMGRRLSQVFKEDHVDGGDIMFKLLLEVRKYKTLSRSMVWKMLYLGREPPFPYWLKGDGHREDIPSSGWKRENNERYKMENKKIKSK